MWTLGLTPNPLQGIAAQLRECQIPARALLVGNDGGRLTFHFGGFVSDWVGPILDIFHNGRGGGA
jgi:hypothetical protein